MTPTELFANLRRWLGDSVEPYKWLTAELVDYYNWSLDDLALETNYFEEASTEAVIYITLVAGTPDYAYDQRILDIKEARVVGETTNLTQRSIAELIQMTNTWRYLNSVTGTNLSFDATADTITSTSATTTDLSVFSEGDYIEVGGSTSNNETYLIDSVTSTVITVDTTFNPIPLTEVAGDQVVIRSLNVGTPLYHAMDYRTGYITLSPVPDAAGVLTLSGVIKQLTPLTSATISTATIPIKSEYHLRLLDGIMHKSFLKSQPNTFNAEKSQSHGMAWRETKERVKRDLIKLRAKSETIKPHNGCL